MTEKNTTFLNGEKKSGVSEDSWIFTTSRINCNNNKYKGLPLVAKRECKVITKTEIIIPKTIIYSHLYKETWI